MAKEYYAHSLEGKPQSQWQLIETHLKNVAEMARSFSNDFKAGEWGYLAGIWHDIGKYSAEFQKRIGADEDAHIENSIRPDHSTAGAKHAVKTLGEMGMGKILAYAIAGHHGGLPDGKANGTCLAKRLKKEVPNYAACPETILNTAKQVPLPFQADMKRKSEKKRFAFKISFFIRMVFSSLTDADFLDTEAFIDPEKSSWRDGYPQLDSLHEKLEDTLEQLAGKDSHKSINRHRSDILQSCLDAAEKPRGLFSLTVPTGGGKTISSLAFAMKHARKHGLKRIIYVIPYTTIVEQNALVFREILGDNAVLEHHSNFEPKKEDRRSRLASENWDAPIIVTTNVQFFESLFARKTSKCRKLYNIAKSVVILDEAQMLPPHLLRPCMEALRELSNTYRTSIVLCTATQPALSTSSTFKDGLDDVHEITPNPEELYNIFKRVEITKLPVLPDDELAEMIAGHNQVLCIVNTRKHARAVYEQIRESEGTYHLSALMCPEHRSSVLKQIKTELKKGWPCRVVSTQLVEAGVDIDFPVVFRTIAGIDSIAQAAGRCNREGELTRKGRVFVFTPEVGLPPGYFRQSAETAETVMHNHKDFLSLDAVREYFERLYWMKGEKLDEKNILKMIREGERKGDFPFRKISKAFRIIESNMAPVIIPWNKEAEKLVRGLRYSQYPGSLARKLQRFTVQVYPEQLNVLENAKVVECLHDQYKILTNMDIYREDLGLCPEEPEFHEVESLIF